MLLDNTQVDACANKLRGILQVPYPEDGASCVSRAHYWS